MWMMCCATTLLSSVRSQRDLDISACGIRVRTCSVGCGDELFRGGLVQLGECHVEVHAQRESLAFSVIERTDPDLRLHGPRSGSNLLLVREILNGSAEACGISSAEELFRVRRLPFAAHLRRQWQRHIEQMVRTCCASGS